MQTTPLADPVTFADLGLSAKVLEAVTASGYTSPTPIQSEAIPVAVTGRDVLGIAQTGTGKTASFVLPMITRLETGRARARMPRSLILAPTRELAAQVAQSFEKYGVNHKLNVALLIGGVSMDDQIRKLDRGADVLIATPGRMLDHFQRGRLMLMGVEILVIDEADRMLDMGFIPDIEKICKLLPPVRQTLFFSATMPAEITRLVSQFLKDPVRVEVAKPATTAKTITQRFRYCENGEEWAKREVLRDLIREQNVKNAIIFCNRKRDVAILLKSLLKHGFNAGALHGDMDQSSRMATLDAFRAGKISLLAASDVAARGLDIPDVSHVFNFDVPWAADDYVHRIGRTGRAGREGFSATLVGPEDLKLVKDIEKLIGEDPTWIGEPPTEADFADAGKRRRGRGRGASAGGSAGGREASGRDRGGRGRDGGRSGASRGGAERTGERRPQAEPPVAIDPSLQPLDFTAADEALDIVAANVTPPPMVASDDLPRTVATEAGDVAERSPRKPRRRRGRGRGEGGEREGQPREARDGGDQPRERQGQDSGRVNGAAPEHPARTERTEAEAGAGQGDRGASQGRRDQRRAPRDDQRSHQTAREPNTQRPAAAAPRKPERSADSSQTFSDGVPAFLQRPVRRPAKVAGD